MFETLKQSIFTSLGVASLAKDKVEALATEVARRAQLTETQAKEFRDELLHRSEAAKVDLEKEIDRRIDHAFVQVGIIKATAIKKAEEARDELQTMIDRRIDATFERLKLARIEDVESLTARIEQLERSLKK